MSGVTSTGFVAKTIEEIKVDIEAEVLATIRPDLDLSPSQALGQIIGIASKKIAEVWEAAAVAYNAFNRGAAEGALLDFIGLLTGTPREPATKSLVATTINLDASTTLPAGSISNVDGQPDNQWELVTAVTSTTAGNYPAIFRALTTGPKVANSGTLTVITTPVPGWNSITNAGDADLGSDIETDAKYRLRQVEELTAPGSSTVDAIRVDVLGVENVEECFVFENTTLVIDGDGIPGKAFETVIFDGDPPAAEDDAVAQAIWDSKPSGIQAYGTTDSGIAKDTLNQDRTVEFTRADVLYPYFTYTLDIDPTSYPDDGDDQVKEAAVSKGLQVLGMGDDIVALVFRAAALSVTGVTDVTDFKLGFSPSPSGTTNLSVTNREIARVVTANIVVNT